MIAKANNPGKKIQDICKALGEEYSIGVIDYENVIYRDLDNGFDFEISGLDTGKKKMSATLYIWNTRIMQTVDTISDIHSLEELKTILEISAEKYHSLSAD